MHTSIDKVQSNKNYVLTDAHLNKFGNDTLEYKNTVTGAVKTFPNVHHDEAFVSTKAPGASTLDAIEHDPNMKLVDVHVNKLGNDVLTFENSITHDIKVFPNVHHSEEKKESGESHHDLNDILNDANWGLIGKHKNHLGNYTLIFASRSGAKATFPNVKLE